MQVSKQIHVVVSIFAAFSLLLSACGGTPNTPETSSASTAVATSAAAVPTAAAAETTASAGAAATAPAATSSDKPVIVLQSVDISSLDPQFGSSLTDANVLNHVFSRLTDQNGTGEIIPMLATEWKMLDDKTVWEFKLNPAAKWADGQPVTGQDVIFSWQRASDPANKITGNTQYLLNNMGIVSIEAPDANTVRIKTEQPSITLPNFLAEFYILPEHFYKGMSLEDAALKSLGSGPYKISEWVKDERVTMVLNENYWGTAAKIPEVIWRPVPEAATRLAELQSGGADLIDNLSPDKVGDVESAGLRTVNVATGRRIYIGFNQAETANPALKDKLVRQALNYAVDFDAINTALLNSAGKRTGSTVNPPWQDAEVTPYTYDVAKAKQLLTQAGWTDSDGDGVVDKAGTPLKLTFDSPNGRYIKDLQIAQAVAQYLSDAGVAAEVTPFEWTNYRALLTDKKLDDLYLLGSGSNFEGQADISDLDYESSSNYGQWNNTQFGELFTKLQGELDSTARQTQLNQMQVLVKDQAPYIFLYMQVAFFGTSQRLANWQPYPNERIHLEGISLK